LTAPNRRIIYHYRGLAANRFTSLRYEDIRGLEQGKAQTKIRSGDETLKVSSAGHAEFIARIRDHISNRS